MKEDFKIPLIFLFTGILWINFSDSWLFSLPSDKSQQLLISSIKGYGFISLSALMLYFLVRYNNRKILKEQTHLQQQEEENKRLFEVLNRVESFIIFTNSEGKVTWVNKALQKHTGYSLNDFVGHYPGELLRGAGTSKEAEQEIANAVMSRASCTAEILNYKKSGEEYWCHLNITPLFNDKNELTGFLSIQSDVTQHRQLVHQLTEQNELFRKVTWMTSHDIRRPLSSILSLVTLIKTGNEAENKECLHLLYQSSEELDQIIRTVTHKINQLQN